MMIMLHHWKWWIPSSGAVCPNTAAVWSKITPLGYLVASE